ncbi:MULTISPECIES: copper-binding protein [Novilysobacter]|uniref:copper-binding protein n=1 Tax=Novilysobacter TaxID=3382699 RepID=UPI002FCC3C9E
MKTLTTYTMTALLALGLLAGCSPEADEQNLAAPDAAAPAAPAPGADGMQGMQRDNAGTTSASTTGTVQAVDASAGTITIDHGPVDALQWPAMTMTFQAPGIDLGSIEPGDEVSFEFTSTGMDGTITSISSQ